MRTTTRCVRCRRALRSERTRARHLCRICDVPALAKSWRKLAAEQKIDDDHLTIDIRDLR